MVNMSILIKVDIEENGKIMKKMVEVYLNFIMEMYLMESLKIIKKMERIRYIVGDKGLK